MEVTIRFSAGIREPKSVYLTRIMTTGTRRARILKLADRISNITALGFVHEQDFVHRYLAETKAYILPYAQSINADMFRELSDLVADREQKLSSRLQA
jgi:GTP pyrophosphokinase